MDTEKPSQSTVGDVLLKLKFRDVMRLTVFLLALVAGISNLRGQAQDTALQVGEEDSLIVSSIPDSAFAQARELAYNEEYGKAEKILQLNILRFPENLDYPLFLARVKTWQEEYDTARSLLKDIYQRDTGKTGQTAFDLLAKVERYDGQFEKAITLSDSGLKERPKSEILLVNKAQSQVQLLQYPEALNTVDTALQYHPKNKELQQLQLFLLNQLIAEGIAVGAGVDYFTRGTSPWLNALAQYGSFTDLGMVIGRVNYASRFQDQGLQFEIDAYPQIGNGRYFYLNAGYSGSELFPTWRFGGEFFSIIDGTPLEASLGFRHLRFSDSNKVTMYTGTLGWYFGNNFLQFRPFFIDQPNAGWGSSYNFLYRKFITGMGDYFQISAGFGFVPQQRLIDVGGVIGPNLFTLENQYLGFAYQKLLNESLYVRLDLTLTNQEEFTNPGSNLQIMSLFFTLGLRL